MAASIRRVLVRSGVVAALSLAVLALAACGSSAAPTDEAPATTAAEPAADEGDQAAIVDEHMTGTEDSAPAALMAPTFELPDARDGLDVSLESYRGDKNVVLVFYRGFW